LLFGTITAEPGTDPFGGTFVAEIHVAPKGRNRAVLWIILVAIVIAAVAWYFLAGPGVHST